MALILLSEFSSMIVSALCLKITLYQMEGTCSNSYFFSYQSLTWRSLRPSLVFWLFRILLSIMTFLVAGLTLDLDQVLGRIIVFLTILVILTPVTRWPPQCFSWWYLSFLEAWGWVVLLAEVGFWKELFLSPSWWS